MTMAKDPETVDYGATADAYAADKSDHNTTDDEEEEETSLEMGADEQEGHSEHDDSDEEEDTSEQEEEEEEEEAPVARNPAKRAATAEEGDEPCSFDLRNLTAVNNCALNEQELYLQKTAKKSDGVVEEEKLTIDNGNAARRVNEEYLLHKATDGCTQLLEAIWQLPTERSDAGPMVTLPSYDVIPIPRTLPPPPPKQETRWEKFAKERGIGVNQEKRSRKVWDEGTQSWKFRTGKDKANNDGAWPIMEVGANDDPYADPWETKRDEKFKREEQNRRNQLKNQERAGLLPKGTTRRVIKSREQARESGKAGGALDRSAPVGVPVDITKDKLRGKASVTAALKHTQVSTASLGKFDKMREGEPERKQLIKASKKKRKFMAEEPTKATSGEQERTSKVLQTVLQGGGVEKEKARKKGKLAKGVSAYDYEFDDGADNTLFKKKKGRAAAGKNRKMTKKRIK